MYEKRVTRQALYMKNYIGSLTRHKRLAHFAGFHPL